MPLNKLDILWACGRHTECACYFLHGIEPKSDRFELSSPRSSAAKYTFDSGRLNGSPSLMHTIRLRGPWKSEWAEEKAIYQRTFHRPTGLHPQQRLALHFRFVSEIDFAALTVLLNERQLAASQNLSVLEADVTDGLLPFNRLEIHFPMQLLSFPPATLPGGLPGALPDSPPTISQLVETCLVISD